MSTRPDPATSTSSPCGTGHCVELAMRAGAVNGHRWGMNDAYRHTAVLVARIASRLPAPPPDVAAALDLMTDPARLAAHRARMLAPQPASGHPSGLLDPGRLVATLTSAEISTLTGVPVDEVRALADAQPDAGQ
ncbi:hypothetical protein CA850_32815 [Micromonospora echinospora]|uniref:Uncharacterized protein n=1 Tax=Micromonospora echinospora TaxID=1877 RepID=A0A1C4WIE1_MICEC|nr:hypothetical protein [Micromonospora echinospora]OZV71922.1 hypothetical protein CA850_32815 [Micromonospora echinospora]SCE95958.1 hypothetical protein GA0070618_2217 [Micromonospora echinospora]